MKLKRFKEIVRYAYDNVPFYKKKYDEAIEHFLNIINRGKFSSYVAGHQLQRSRYPNQYCSKRANVLQNRERSFPLRILHNSFYSLLNLIEFFKR